MNVQTVRAFNMNTTAFKATHGNTHPQNQEPVVGNQPQDKKCCKIHYDSLEKSHLISHCATQACLILLTILLATTGGKALALFVGGQAGEAITKKLLKEPVKIKTDPLNIFSYIRAVLGKAKDIIKKV